MTDIHMFCHNCKTAAIVATLMFGFDGSIQTKCSQCGHTKIHRFENERL